METIPENIVETAWQEVAELSLSQAGKEMQKMAKNQPDLLAFLMAMTEDLEPEIKELAVYMAFVVYRIYEGSRHKIKKITSKEIIDCYETNEDLMGRLGNAGEEFIDRVAEIQISRQPFIMKYVVDTLIEEPEEEDNDELTDEDKGFLFILLKTVVDLLDKT
jgi:hypothetical protein